ncbi:fic family toxin-antitoxin system, toxin component [Streptomyces sp. NPDC087440]|uniref:fic family toxin-antitoxin system, toxin component n=1 Tax=Streptomyces sp. NPDC087440 TaxID=3365790 RepID=UPI003821CB8B
MPFTLFVDERWILDQAESRVPGDPDVTDFGSIAAAVARHRAEVMGVLVYAEPHHRAAALLHQLVRVPALEHSNEFLGVGVAVAYLTASGKVVKVSSDEAVDLAVSVAVGSADVRQVAAALKSWAQ